MKHVGNLSVTLMNYYFFICPVFVLKGKLEGTGFEQRLTVLFEEPESFSQNGINM